MRNQTFYDILRVAQNSKESEITNNYRFLRSRTTDFLEILRLDQAYNTLINDRASYDIGLMLGNKTNVIIDVDFEKPKNTPSQTKHSPEHPVIQKTHQPVTQMKTESVHKTYQYNPVNERPKNRHNESIDDYKNSIIMGFITGVIIVGLAFIGVSIL
jgi:hypothetical protein